MKKRWTPRVMQTFYKEWALELGTQLLGKVRYAAQSFPPYIGEVYQCGRTYTIYKGQNKQEAKNAVLMHYAKVP